MRTFPIAIEAPLRYEAVIVETSFDRITANVGISLLTNSRTTFRPIYPVAEIYIQIE